MKNVITLGLRVLPGRRVLRRLAPLVISLLHWERKVIDVRGSLRQSL